MDSIAVGRGKWDLDTPALVVDLDALDFNIHYLAQYMKQYGKAWRPHAKAHKTPAIAQRQVQAGAIGVTCAKLGEAEVMATSGIRDILIGNQVVGSSKIARLAALQRQAEVKVAVDDLDNAREISQVAEAAGVRVPVVIEVDTGLGRAGLPPGEPVLALARELVKLPGLSFRGLFTWEGFVLREKDLAKRKELIYAALKSMTDTRAMLEGVGIPITIVSAGGTGTYLESARYPGGITEIEAGGGSFMDLTYAEKYADVGPLKFALTVLSTVTSKPTPDRAICDAGRKAMSDQRMMPRALNAPGVELVRLSAEHGTLKLSGEGSKLKVGDKLEFIPGYSDDTIYLYDQIYALRRGRVEAVWPILARGRKD